MVSALLILGLALIAGSLFINANQAEPQRRAIRFDDFEKKRRR